MEDELGRDIRGVAPARFDRRTFLAGAASLAGLAIASRVPSASALVEAGSPFTLGIASGDPRSTSVVLWTRLAVDPLNGGGMPNQDIAVKWQVASDEAFANIVKSGTTYAKPGFAHSVHVIVNDLRPGRWYFYRFRSGGFISRAGRTKTAPGASASPEALAFAFVSCQDWQAGYYPAYENLAAEDLDLVVHLGDYIYEYGPEPMSTRVHDGPETNSLTSYRNRHALYKSDTDLQEAHANFPWIVTFDDHEVDNNYADEIPEDDQTRDALLKRRANAYRAYYEHLPLRNAQLPQGPDMRLYRRARFGDLAEFSILDTRQYRSDQPCGDGIKERCAAALAESQTMTGPAQERWLLEGLATSPALWNFIAQQTILADVDFLAGPSEGYNMDQWDGYVAARNRIIAFLMHQRPSNPVVLTGDIHSSWVTDIKTNFADPSSPTVATEFVGTSITSDFPAAFIPVVEAAVAEQPHVKFFDGQYRGYVRCHLDRTRMRTDFRVVPTVQSPSAPVCTLATFEVESGTPGAQQVGGSSCPAPV